MFEGVGRERETYGEVQSAGEDGRVAVEDEYDVECGVAGKNSLTPAARSRLRVTHMNDRAPPLRQRARTTGMESRYLIPTAGGGFSAFPPWKLSKEAVESWRRLRLLGRL